MKKAARLAAFFCCIQSLATVQRALVFAQPAASIAGVHAIPTLASHDRTRTTS